MTTIARFKPSVFLFVLLGFIAFHLQSFIPVKKPEAIEAFWYRSALKIADSTGTGLLWDNSLLVATSNDLVLCWQPYQEHPPQITTYSVDDGPEQETVTRSYTREWFFVYRSGESTALFFDSVSRRAGVRLPLDSLLKQHNLAGLQPCGSGYRDSLLRKEETPDGSSVTAVYVAQTNADSTVPDTSYFSYSRQFNKAPFPLSADGVTLDGLKPSRIRVIDHRRCPASSGVWVPVRMEFLVEISEVSLSVKRRLPAYFGKYRL